MRELKSLDKKLGHRGAFLLVMATLDGFYGFNLTQPQLHPFNTFFTTGQWSIVWFFSSVMCFIYAFKKQDRPAFFVTMMLKILWGIVMLNHWLDQGDFQAWVGVVVWWSIAASIAVVVTWFEGPEIIDVQPPMIDANGIPALEDEFIKPLPLLPPVLNDEHPTV